MHLCYKGLPFDEAMKRLYYYPHCVVRHESWKNHKCLSLSDLDMARIVFKQKHEQNKVDEAVLWSMEDMLSDKWVVELIGADLPSVLLRIQSLGGYGHIVRVYDAVYQLDGGKGWDVHPQLLKSSFIVEVRNNALYCTGEARRFSVEDITAGDWVILMSSNDEPVAPYVDNDR